MFIFSDRGERRRDYERDFDRGTDRGTDRGERLERGERPERGDRDERRERGERFPRRSRSPEQRDRFRAAPGRSVLYKSAVMQPNIPILACMMSIMLYGR